MLQWKIDELLVIILFMMLRLAPALTRALQRRPRTAMQPADAGGMTGLPEAPPLQPQSPS